MRDACKKGKFNHVVWDLAGEFFMRIGFWGRG